MAICEIVEMTRGNSPKCIVSAASLIFFGSDRSQVRLDDGNPLILQSSHFLPLHANCDRPILPQRPAWMGKNREYFLGSASLTLVDHLWRDHLVKTLDDETDLIAIDRIFMHERVGGRMLGGVIARNAIVKDPALAFGVMDHIIDTTPGRGDSTLFKGGAEFIKTFRDLAARFDIRMFDIRDPGQGIVHVMAPEQAIALPGTTFVCGDSHTCTIGGLGALAWGIGITQGEHALITQTLVMTRPQQMRIWCDGALQPGVFAKDIILALIGQYGANGGDRRAVELDGPAIRSLSVDARLTICNMAVEFGAWTGIIAPDDTVFQYLNGRPYAPKDKQWDSALAYWRTLQTGPAAKFDVEMTMDCATLSPQVTWGTSPEHVVAASGVVPDPASVSNSNKRRSMEQALRYAELTPGMAIADIPIEAAFIGSCTNARIEDLRAAAVVLRGRKVAANVKALCVPGSTPVRRQAEVEGLDKIFLDAGFEWRESGCSLCFFANGDSFGDAKRVITSTNRNFENRQGPGVRSHLASPATVAASAIVGRITGADRIDR